MTKRKPILLLISLLLLLCANAQVFKTVHVTAQNTLGTLFTTTELNTITDLKLTGEIDGRDFIILKDKMPALTSLDLGDVKIKSYFYYWNEVQAITVYKEDYLQPLNSKLTSIILPKNLAGIESYALSQTKITTITIPKTTQRILNNAFRDCKDLKTVIIEDAPVTFHEYSFAGCTSLENIQIGNAATSMWYGVFSSCSSLTNITLPATLTSLDEGIFKNCSNLKSIEIPSTIQIINKNMFEGCVNLAEVKIPNSIHLIQESAFNNCIKLNHIELPKSITHIYSNAFYNCTGLKKINLPSSLQYMESAFSMCTSIDTVFVNSYIPLGSGAGNYFYNSNTKNKTLVVPFKTKNLYQTSVYWSDFGSIIEAGNGVYLGQKSKYISDNEGDTIQISIESNCKWTVSCNETWVTTDKIAGENSAKIIATVSKNNLIAQRKAEIAIFDGELRPQIFTLNQFGKKVILNSTAGNLQIADSLLNTENLKIKGTMDWRDFGTIRYKLQNLNALDLSDVNINEYIIKKTNYWDNDIIYPKNELPGNAFSEKLNRLKLPFTLKSFATNSLIYAGNIQDLYVNFRNPSIINFVSSGVFQHVLNTNLHVPYGTVSIYKNTNIWNTIPVITANDTYLYPEEESKYFIKGTEEKYVVKVNSNVPWSVQCDSNWVSLRKLNTANGDSLEITVSQNNGYKPHSAAIALVSDFCDTYYFYVTQDGTSFNLSLNAGTLKESMPSELKKNLTKLKLSGTMYARDFFFLRDSMPQLQKIDLKDIRILSNTDSIWDSYGFYQLQKFNANEIPDNAFSIYNSSIENTSLKSIILPDTVLIIGQSAFNRCIALEEINIGNLTKSIKSGAFESCKSLASVTIPASVTAIGYDLFYNCTSLTNCNILFEIKEIPSGMFKLCKNLKSFEIPASVTAIGETAFYGCNNLNSINLSDNIKTIGNGAFGYCTSFSEFSIPKNITTLGTYILKGCSNLKKCTIAGYITKLPDELFSGCTSLNTFDIPRSIKEIGSNAFYGCAGLDSIRVYSHTPATLADDVFYNASVSTCKLIVPKGSKVLYQNASVWKDFRNIIESLDTPNNLYITTPTIVTNKMVDGNTNAVITQLGTLQGVDTSDIGNVNVTAIATYNDASVGVNKTITVVYTLTGSAKDKYIAPENDIISNAKISDFVTLNTLTKPEAACEGDALDVNYSIKTGTPTHYKITFTTEALNAGLKNESYTALPTADNSGSLVIPIAVNTIDGTYSGTLKMKNELNFESPDYPFEFTVNVSENLIRTKFDDIILFNNADKRFVAYQWLMNGIEIPGATKQFFQSPVGLIGMYSVKLTTTDGKTVYTCPKVLNLFSVKAQVRATPNPVKVNEVCKIEFSGFTDEQLKKANVAVYTIQGACVYKSNAVESITELQLPAHGVYIGKVSGAGSDYVFKIMVTK